MHTLSSTAFIFWALASITLYINNAVALLPSGVIFPLYIYPGTGCTGWSAVSSAIQTYGTVQFYVIVNPASGPGGAPGSQPDTNYQSCVASLRTTGATQNNVKILGYVATGFGATATSTVTNDIDTYSRWSTGYRPDGIFFDEVATSASFLTAYQTYASRVHTDFGTSFVVLNPGAKPESSGYFSIADMIVTFEGFYNDFSASQLTIGSLTPASKQAVILHDGPSVTSSQLVKQLASTLGVHATFITNFPNAVAYQNIPSDWNGFCIDVVSAQTA